MFDGLIGLDNLKLLQANIDFNSGYLITPYAKIILMFYKTKLALNCITISPRTEQLISVKIDITKGEIIILHQKIHNCEIPECLNYYLK